MLTALTVTTTPRPCFRRFQAVVSVKLEDPLSPPPFSSSKADAHGMGAGARRVINEEMDDTHRTQRAEGKVLKDLGLEGRDLDGSSSSLLADAGRLGNNGRTTPRP